MNHLPLTPSTPLSCPLSPHPSVSSSLPFSTDRGPRRGRERGVLFALARRRASSGEREGEGDALVVRLDAREALTALSRPAF